MKRKIENFNYLVQSVNLIVLTISVLLGGIWAYYKFEKLNQEEFSSKQLEKIKRELDTMPAIDIKLDYDVFKNNGQTYLLVEVNIQNIGNVPFVSKKGDAKMIIYKTNNIYKDFESNNSQLDENTFFKVLEEASFWPKKINDLDSARLSSDFFLGIYESYILPKNSKRSSFSHSIPEKGIYYIQYIIKASSDSKKVISNINESTNEDDKYWIEYQIVNVE